MIQARPTRQDIAAALAAAGSSHHIYEQKFLNGKRDEQWPSWYAAYVLGRLGDFTSPDTLTRWLESAPGSDDWSASTAAHVMRQLGT